MSFNKKYTSTMLTSASVLGVIFTTILASKATVKAKKTLDDYRDENLIFSISKKDIFRLTWKYYVSTAFVGVSTIVCIIGADVLSKKQRRSLLGVYALLNESLQKYKDSIDVIFGNDFDNEIVKKEYKENKDELIEMVNGNEILCYDLLSQRYFSSTLPTLLDAQYQVNKLLHNMGYVCVNKLYEYLEMDGIEGGDDIYWSENWIDFQNSYVDLEDGMVCIVVSVDRIPVIF